MPNVRISDLPLAALPLTGAELMEVTQTGLSKQVTVDEIAAVAPGLDAEFVTLSASVGLLNERILTAGANISIIDSGPGLPVTINAASGVPVGTVEGQTIYWDNGGLAYVPTSEFARTAAFTYTLNSPAGSASIEITAPGIAQVADLLLLGQANGMMVRHQSIVGLTAFFQTDAAGAPGNTMLSLENNGRVFLNHNGTNTAQTASLAAGGFLVNNTVTGGGLERALTTADLAGGGSLAALSDVSLIGQAQYDLLFNVDGTNWEDTAGNLIFDSAALALQFAAGYGINMGATPLRVLEMGASGTPSVTIEHTTVEVIAEVSTVSNVEVPLTGGTLPLLTEGDEYLLMAVAQHHQGNTGGENVHGADIAVAQASGVPFSNMRDDIEPPACAVASDQGQWFSGLNQIQYSVASHGQITLEHSAGAGQTHYVNNAILMAFNLTDFGTENVDWFSSVTAPFVTVTDAGWSNLTPSITVGDGVSDWLIFGSFQTDQPQAGGQIQYGLFDGSVNSDFAMHQFADVADIKSIFFSAVFTGIASTTFQTAARAVAASGNTARIFTSGIYALRLNRFAQYSIQSASGPTSPPSAAEFSLLTDSVVASSNSDWGILAFVRNQWVANTLSGTTYGRANINAGGFTTIAGFDTPPISVVENATNELTPKQMVPRIAELTGVVATDTVGAELRWIPPTNFGPTRAAVYNMVMFTWDTLDTSVLATTLGDPTVGTQIDGISLSIAGAYTLPVADGALGEVLTTDGAGAVTFTPAGVPDPLIIGSINLTSALSTSTLGAPYIDVPINIGANLVGTMPMTQLSRQNIQVKPSAFSFNSTLFINTGGAGTAGADTIIGSLNGANIEVEFGVAVRFQHGISGNVIAQTVANGLQLPLDGTLYIDARAAAAGNIASNGQLWVATGTGNLNFTTAAGVTTDLVAGGGVIPGGANPLQLDDNVNIALGTGSDALLFFNGTDMIQRMPTGGDWRLQHTAAEDMIVATANAHVSLYFNNLETFRSQNFGASTATSGALVIGSNGVTFQNVGFNEMPIVNLNVSATFVRTTVGALVSKQSGAAVSWTFDQDTSIPVGATWELHNVDTEVLTINSNDMTIRWMDGVTAGGATGNRSFASGGAATITKYSSTEMRLRGNGLS